MEYTKGEWETRGNFPDGDFDVIVKQPHYIQTIAARIEAANAQRIVKAVNCHDDLVEALKAIMDERFTREEPSPKTVLMAENALSKAEGK